MYCTNCGRRIGDGNRFCTQCGRPAGPAAAAGTPGRGPQRRLVRIALEKKIAGVCAGVARYFDADVTLVRVVWLVFAICTVIPGFLAYLAAWIAVPKEDQPHGQRGMAVPHC
jgi:phage shock protein C